MNTFYLTTPIYYPNARPHVGSAYTTIVCDVLARYKRMCGYDVAFLTGTDEHGEKLQRAAAEAGTSPREFVAEKRKLFIDLWKKLGIDPVVYPYETGVPQGAIRFVYTDHPDHFKSVRRMLLRARANKIDGQEIIYKKRYEGRYCIFDEMYVSDGGDPINCPNCGRPTELISEENYFFRLSAYKDELLKHYEKHPEFVRPDFRMNEVKNFVKDLRDISISRKRIKWGIPFPLDEDHDDPEQVFYVWYDALVSYMTGIGYAQGENGSEMFQKYWRNAREPKAKSQGPREGHEASEDIQGSVPLASCPLADSELVHMVGKDILRFHAVYWPAFIMAAYPGQPEMLPTTVFAHGWIYYEQDKMSKSKGNVVYPEPIIDAFESFGAPGDDALRYYLLREAPFGQDTSFSYEALIQRYNSDLANDLGNLASRTLTMLIQYCAGKIPPRPPLSGNDPYWDIEGAYEYYAEEFDAMNFGDALPLAGLKVSQANKAINDAKPWELAKSSSAQDRQSLERSLYQTADFLRAVCVLLYPVIPVGMERLWRQLGCEDYLGEIGNQRIDQLKWGGLEPGTKVGKPEPIFPRLDKAKALAKLEEYAEADRERSQPKEKTTVRHETPGLAPTGKSVSGLDRAPSPPAPLPRGEGSTYSGGDSDSKDVALSQGRGWPEGPGEGPASREQPEVASVPEARVTSPAGQSAVGSSQSAVSPTTANQQPTTGKISIDDFAKVEMVVGQILSAEPIPKAQKLLKLQVDIGTETRQVCAGIAEYYKPEEIVGQKIVLVANLEPRKLRGVESNGMVVAASIGAEGRPVLATFKEDVPNGTRLK